MFKPPTSESPLSRHRPSRKQSYETCDDAIEFHLTRSRKSHHCHQSAQSACNRTDLTVLQFEKMHICRGRKKPSKIVVVNPIIYIYIQYTAMKSHSSKSGLFVCQIEETTSRESELPHNPSPDPRTLRLVKASVHCPSEEPRSIQLSDLG